MLNRITALFCLIACLWSCSNDFDVNAEWKEFGVVYGLLDLSKDVQYVRVNKAFLDTTEPIQSATEIAASSVDSIYFSENISVSLEEFNTQGSFSKTIDLTRVSGTEAGLAPKEMGAFSSEEFFVYQTEEKLRSGFTYEVKVITDAGNTLSSSTALADDFNFAIPMETLGDPNQTITYEIAAFDVIKVAWRRSENATIYDATMRINIQEYSTLDESPVGSSFNLDWVLLSNFKDERILSFENLETNFQYDNFLNFLQNQLEPKEGVFRKIEFIDYIVSAGTEDLEAFRAISIAQGSNLNSGQAKPIFSNIDNGIGLFASVNTKRRRVLRLSTSTVRDIACNPITEDLNFVVSTTSFSEPCF